MTPTTKIYADLCHLWTELALPQADGPSAIREQKELLDTVQSKLPQVKYFKLIQGAFIKVSRYADGCDVLEILDIGGLSEGLVPNIILGTLAGWCAALPFVLLASADEYHEALAVTLDADPKVVLMEKMGAC